MKHHIETLQNGLRIITAPMHEAQSLTVQITVGVGSRYEDPLKNGGVSHFLEHLFFKGTKTRPSTKIISEQIDAVGGMCNAYTSNDITSFYAKVPHQHGLLALDILCDIMRNSLFDAAEIDRERDVVIEEMNVYRDDPASFVHRLVPRLLWPNQPLSADVIGEEGVIKRMDRETILQHFATYYQPSNMVICLAGNLKAIDGVKEATRLMGDMKVVDITPVPLVTEEIAEAKVEAIAKDTAQSHLVIGAKSPAYLHPDTPAARVVSTILGRGLSSRLFLNVRERKGLAYSINTNLENFVDTGYFSVYAGVNTEKTNQAIEAIIEELIIISEQKVGEEELSKAKNQIIGGLQMSIENNLSVSDRLSGQLIILGKIKSLEKTLADIEAVTADDVLRVAAEILKPANLRMGIITADPKDATKTFEKIVSQ